LAPSWADCDAAEAAFDAAKVEVVVLSAQIQAAKIAINLARVTLGYTA